MDDYVIAFKNANEIEQQIYLIRGVSMKFGREGLKELAMRSNRSLEEFIDCASLGWFHRNLKRKKHGRNKKPHVTAGESIAPIIAQKLENPYRRMEGWDLRKDGARHDFC